MEISRSICKGLWAALQENNELRGNSFNKYYFMELPKPKERNQKKTKLEI